MWKYSSQADPSTDPDIPNIKRQSISELEGDASVDGWLVFMTLQTTLRLNFLIRCMLMQQL